MSGFLSTPGYFPHRFLSQPGLVWTSVLADGLIAVSCGVVFACLLPVVRRERRFLAFGAFLLACAGTHSLGVATDWWPGVWLWAAAKVGCAAASMLAALYFAKTEGLDALPDAKRALQQSEAFLEQTGRLAGVGGWEINLVTKELTWAAETYRILGAEPWFQPRLEESLSRYAAQHQPRLRAAIERATTHGEGLDLEVEMTTVDGREIWVRMIGAVEFSDGKPVRMRGAFQDITARVNERLAIEQANARAAVATDSGGIGIWDWDIPNDRLIWDAWMYRLYGLEPRPDEPVVYDVWARHLHPEDRAATEQALWNAVAGLGDYEPEFRVIWDDGSVHHIKGTARVTRDAAGQPLGMIGTNRDITRRKEAEAMLVEQASLLDLAHDGIMVRSLEGKIRFWNHGAEEMYGYTKEEAVHSMAHQLLSTIFPQPLPLIEAELLRNERWEGELTHTTRDGRKIVVASRWVLERGKDGAPAGVLEINNDITDRKKAEEAARQSHEKEQLLVRGVKEYAILLLDAEGHVTSWNEGAEGIKGYRADEILGRHFSAFYTAEDAAGGKPARGLDIARRQGRYEEEGWRVRKDGTLFWADVVITALFDDKGELRGFGKVTRDITERMRTEAAMREAQVAAEAASRAKSDFLANMSHEIRTPMNAIVGMTQLALRASPSPEQSVYLTKIAGAADSLLNIINDILDFSKIEAGRMELEAIPFSVEKVLRDLDDIVSHTAKRKNIALSFSVSRDVPAVLIGDPLRLGQILINLVNNGIKFTSQGSVSVAVSAARITEDTTDISFAVADTGIGMNEATLPRLFQSFNQADPSVTRKYGGTGLGLAISKQLCDLMGGTISATSEEGKGSLFVVKIRFPVATGGAQAPSEAGRNLLLVADDRAGEANRFDARALSSGTGSAALEGSELAGRRVLLVEDNPINQDLATELLAGLGIKVSVAVNGREGVDRILTEPLAEPFDLVLMDIQMPVMDGLTATRLIRADPRFRELPIIAMTAHAMSSDRDKSLAAGMNDHLTKPISLERLWNALRRWMPAASSSAPGQPVGAAADDSLPEELWPFDLQAVLRRTNGNPRVLRKMLLSFCSQYAEAGPELRRLVNEGKMDEGESLVHSLKGSAQTLAANELSHAADALEVALRTGVTHRLHALIDEVEERLRPALAAAMTLDRRVHTADAAKAWPASLGDTSSLLL